MRGVWTRLGLALVGLALWFAYPFVFWSGGIAVHRYRCSRAPRPMDVDPCFTDYIPVMELLAFVLTLLLAFPFARFAFTLFAPPSSQRRWGWDLAASNAGSEYYPTLQALAGLGIVWALFHGAHYPAALHLYRAYWAAWIGWFCLGLWMSWPARDVRD